MAEITKPIALDESFNTTEGSPRNVADVLAQGIGDLVTVVSRISHQTTYDELSDLEDVNISAPTNGDVLTYDGSKWVNGQVGGGSVEQMIAPVETSTTASQAYAIGEQFILNGTLYTATAAITAGGTITINGNCTASDSVTNQMFNKLKTLWTNANPKSSFAAQNVQLSSSEYDLLLFIHRANNGSTAPCNSLIVPKGENGNFCVSGTSSNGVIANDRRITYTDDTHLAYADNYYCVSHNAASVSNTRNIPYKIYGIKLT